MKQRSMNKAGKFQIDHVLSWASFGDDEREMKEFQGMQVLCSLINYRLFKEKGCDCVVCGAKGIHFELEKRGAGTSLFNNWHFNLYAVNAQGHFVLMTKDHTVPKSKGGSDDLNNLEPMCSRCNTKKGSTMLEDFQAKRPDLFKIIVKDSIFGKSIGNPSDMSNLSPAEYREKAEFVMGRVKQHYGIEMTEDEYTSFLNMSARSSNVVNRINGYRHIKCVQFNGKDIFVVYSKSDRMIYTALNPENVEKYMRQVPTFGEDIPEKCLELYDYICKRVDEQFKILDTDKETALYFNTCEFPVLMRAKWIKPGTPKVFDKFKFNVKVWEMVEEMVKWKNPRRNDSRPERTLSDVSE